MKVELHFRFTRGQRSWGRWSWGRWSWGRVWLLTAYAEAVSGGGGLHFLGDGVVSGALVRALVLQRGVGDLKVS